ncbi:hypothetical protein GCM10009795_013690 [Nocardioides hankookensis]
MLHPLRALQDAPRDPQGVHRVTQAQVSHIVGREARQFVLRQEFDDLLKHSSAFPASAPSERAPMLA